MFVLRLLRWQKLRRLSDLPIVCRMLPPNYSTVPPSKLSGHSSCVSGELVRETSVFYVAAPEHVSTLTVSGGDWARSFSE